MRRTWLALVAAAALGTGLAACQVTTVNQVDAEVRWSLEGSCGDYGISEWEVSLNGRDYVAPRRFSCSSGGQFSSGVIRVTEGAYTGVVKALSAGGVALATRQSLGDLRSVGSILYIDVGTFRAADFNPAFTCGNQICEDTKGESCQNCPADCGGSCTGCGDKVCDPKTESCSTCPTDCTCAGAKVTVFWTINDTVDGTDKGLSWDTCAEVNAQYVILTVDGTNKQELPCGATDKAAMHKELQLADGTHTFTAVLANANKLPLTNPTQLATLPNLSATQPGELLLDFPWDTFLEPLKSGQLGNYLFAISYEGAGCSQVPKVVGELSLLKLNGTTVTPAPQVCDLAQVCFPADGNTTSNKCYGPNDTLTIKQLKWGSYRLLLQGVNYAKEACYSVTATPNSDIDILVGAGDVNPIVKHDLKKFVPATAGCM